MASASDSLESRCSSGGGWCLLRIRYCLLEFETDKQQQLNLTGKSSSPTQTGKSSTQLKQGNHHHQLKQGTFVGVFFPMDVNFEGHMVFKGLE